METWYFLNNHTTKPNRQSAQPHTAVLHTENLTGKHGRDWVMPCWGVLIEDLYIFWRLLTQGLLAEYKQSRHLLFSLDKGLFVSWDTLVSCTTVLPFLLVACLAECLCVYLHVHPESCPLISPFLKSWPHPFVMFIVPCCPISQPLSVKQMRLTHSQIAPAMTLLISV